MPVLIGVAIISNKTHIDVDKYSDYQIDKLRLDIITQWRKAASNVRFTADELASIDNKIMMYPLHYFCSQGRTLCNDASGVFYLKSATVLFHVSQDTLGHARQKLRDFINEFQSKHQNVGTHP